MELRHLRYFSAVAEEATVIAAAKRLGVAQPALTRQIHALERELDIELLERRPRGVALTPAGEVVLASARHVLRQVDAAVERAREASHGIAGVCVLCAGPRVLASGMIARIVARLASQFPEIELRVIEGMLRPHFLAIQTGEADIGLGVPAPASYIGLASETLDYDLLDAIAISNSHPLAQRESIELAELASETYQGWSRSSSAEMHKVVRAAFAEKGFKPAAVREHDLLFNVSAAIAAGQGWTLIPRRAVALVHGPVCIVPLSDFAAALPHALVWRVAERQPVVRTVMDVIRRLMMEERQARDGVSMRRHTPLVPTPAVTERRYASAAALLELRHLRYFCAVVDAGSFGRAASELELTQPALSRQVGDLERVVGVPLLDRAARGISTTPAGESFHRSARRILEEVAAIPAETQRARRGVTARCVVAGVPTAAALRLLTTLLRVCEESSPRVQLVLEDMATPAQPAALRSGSIDLGVVHASPLSAVEQRGLERTSLTTDQANCALVSRNSPLAARSTVSFDELAALPLLFPERDFQPALYDQLFAAFDRSSFRPRVDAAYDGLRTIWALVAQDRGWAIGFASQCDDPPTGTVSIPVEGFSFPWGLDLLMRADESRSIILDVADRLQEIARVGADRHAIQALVS